MSLSARDAVRAAMTQLSNDSEPDEVDTTETPDPEPVEAEAVEAAGGESESSETNEAEKPSGERPRAADGKFAPKTNAPAAVKLSPTVTTKPTLKPAAPVKPTPVVDPKAPAAQANATAEVKPKLKAPQSFKPTAREDWDKVPESVQAEIDRRERETARALQEAAPARKFQQDFEASVKPFAAMLGNGDPIAATKQLFQTAHVLHYGPPQQKQQLVESILDGYAVPVDHNLVARLITKHGVNIDHLAAALQGQSQPASPANGQAQQQAAFDPNQLVEQITQRVTQSFAKQRQESATQKAQRELQSFVESGKAEFWDDVKDSFGDVMEMAAKRGIALTPEQAYNRAIQLERANPDSEIGKVLQRREEAQRAKASVASTQRARLAASSPKPQPVGVSGGEAKPGDVRGSVAAAIARLNGR
jgi:hypothetical protein